MLRGFFGNSIFAIIARMLCGNHLKYLWPCTSTKDNEQKREGFRIEESPGTFSKNKCSQV